MHINTVTTPSAVVFTKPLHNNIDRFARMAQDAGIVLRPHIKTHRSPQIMELQQRAGARGFTVSTLDEARLCIRHGYTDLTYAVPVEPGKFDRIREIVASGAILHLLTDSPDVAQKLRAHARHHYWRPSVFMKVDCGNHRVGVDPASKTAHTLATLLHTAPEIDFAGILAHSGHAYHAHSDDHRRDIALTERDIMARFADDLRRQGIEVPVVSIGSTPAFATGIALPGIDEARPGNYVFFDYTQVRLGSCSTGDVALYVVASVVSCPPGRVVVDAGATVLSKDPGPVHIDPDCGFGQVYTTSLKRVGVVTSLSQEHGEIRPDTGVAPLQPGDRVLIMPNHSCLVACMVPGYYAAGPDGDCEWWDKG